MKYCPTLIKRKLRRGLMLATASTVGLLAVTAGPAVAATLTTGTGAFTATSGINPTAPPPCAFYGNYHAQLTFTSATVGTYTGPVTFGTTSAPNTYWGENPPGTWLNPPSNRLASNPLATRCNVADPPPTNTNVIPQFSGTLTGTNGAQTLNCSFGATTGTYQRYGNRPGPDGVLGTDDDEVGLDITFTGTTNCPGDASLTVKTSITLAPTPGGTACDSLIAPQSCVLGPDRSA